MRERHHGICDTKNIFTEAEQTIAIDFAGIAVISSSFADELIGKLVAYFGFSTFNQIFRLRNLTETTTAIIDRSVAQRIIESVSLGYETPQNIPEPDETEIDLQR